MWWGGLDIGVVWGGDTQMIKKKKETKSNLLGQ